MTEAMSGMIQGDAPASAQAKAAPWVLLAPRYYGVDAQYQGEQRPTSGRSYFTYRVLYWAVVVAVRETAIEKAGEETPIGHRSIGGKMPDGWHS